MENTSNKIFVFGSNLAGRHGKGAASIARVHFGAKYGQGEGLQGQSYAIPTKDENIRSLSLLQVKRHVDTFLSFARKHDHLTFKVTAIGTGLAGFHHDDIGPMFASAPKNCILPLAWKVYMMDEDSYEYWFS